MRTILTTFIIFSANLAFSQWATVNSTHTRHTNTGNVGIGTASGVTPLNRLHVVGDARADNFIAANGTFNSLSSTSLNFSTNGVNRLTILNSNGFVGIGTSSPAELFHVNGSLRANQFNSVSGNVNALSPANLTFQTNGSSRITVLATNGYTGIGTTSPTALLDVNGTLKADNLQLGGSLPAGYKLAVGGKIIAEEVVVKLQSNWPDYVFEPGYKLPELEELQLFILRNKHLPDVPSANEIEENGISLGEMNSLLLKKIEELTLYVIELKKEITKLKNSNND